MSLYINGKTINFNSEIKKVINNQETISIAKTCLINGFTFYGGNKEISDSPIGARTFLVYTANTGFVLYGTYVYQIIFTDWNEIWYRATWQGMDAIEKVQWNLIANK